MWSRAHTQPLLTLQHRMGFFCHRCPTPHGLLAWRNLHTAFGPKTKLHTHAPATRHNPNYFIPRCVADTRALAGSSSIATGAWRVGVIPNMGVHDKRHRSQHRNSIRQEFVVVGVFSQRKPAQEP